MSRMNRVFAPLFILLLLAGCVSSPAPRPDQLVFPSLVFELPQVERVDLPNGIRLFLREDSEIPLVQVTAMVGAGGIGDPAGKSGLSALFAAALRSGGAGERSPQQVDEALERLAADLMVASDTYSTMLSLSVQSSDLDAGIGILADLLRRPAFDAGRLEVARQQQIESIRRQNDDPGELARRLLMQALYGDHPLGITPTAQSAGSIDREDLLAFHQAYFHPNNLWIAISGDFDRPTLIQQLQTHLGEWPARNFTPQPIPPVTQPPRGVVVAAVKDLPQTTILMGELSIDKSHPDQHALRVMNFILGGGGFNSRMMREIRSDRGLAYSVYSYHQVGRRLPGPFIAGSETKSASTAEVVELMWGEMEGMRTGRVTDEELRIAIESQVNSFVFAFTDSHEVVNQVMRLDFYDYPPGYLETFREKIAAVTVDEVQRVAREHLHPRGQVVVLVGEKSAIDEAAAAAELPLETAPTD